MKTIQMTSRTAPDGTLSLKLASGMSDTEVHVVVVMQPIETGDGRRATTSQDAWKRFVAETSGSIDDPTFMRHEQGAYERREEL